jgi:hypothetical protein
MVPSTFSNFFLAMAGASAALLGLLFVAISVNPERTLGRGAAAERRSLATNAFTALIVAFFISMAALLPGSDVAGTFVALACLGAVASVRLGIQLVHYHLRLPSRTRPLWLRLVQALTTVVGSLIVYGFLFSASLRLSLQPRDVPDVALVAMLVLVCCGLGLFRAWELLGAPRAGVLGWLNPLVETDEAPAPSSAETGGAASHAGVAAARSATGGATLEG